MTSGHREERIVTRGLDSVVAGETRVSYVDGANGFLIYNGYNIHELAEKVSFADVVYLLWYNTLPDAKEREEFRSRIVSEMRLPSQVIRMLELAPPNAHPMAVLRTAVSALSMFDTDSDDLSEEANHRKCARLLGQVMTIIADLYRIRHHQTVLSPDPKMGIAANFLYMFRGNIPDAEEETAFDLLMLLHADHGFNASTFAARVTTSTLSDMHAALSSALGTLKGSAHGGANERVMDMLDEIDNIDVVESYIEGMLNDGKRIMGFGHRVYRVEDPRAYHLRKWSEHLCHRANQQHLYEISHRIEQIVMEKKGIYPNVDFYSATVQHALGIPREYFTAVFSAARTAGWLAHIMEQYGDNRLIRPTSRYVGPWDLTIEPIEAGE